MANKVIPVERLVRLQLADDFIGVFWDEIRKMKPVPNLIVAVADRRTAIGKKFFNLVSPERVRIGAGGDRFAVSIQAGDLPTMKKLFEEMGFDPDEDVLAKAEGIRDKMVRVVCFGTPSKESGNLPLQLVLVRVDAEVAPDAMMPLREAIRAMAPYHSG